MCVCGCLSVPVSWMVRVKQVYSHCSVSFHNCVLREFPRREVERKRDDDDDDDDDGDDDDGDDDDGDDDDEFVQRSKHPWEMFAMLVAHYKPLGH